jgi:hypothetical protein
VLKVKMMEQRRNRGEHYSSQIHKHSECLCQMKGDRACYSTEMHDNIADKHTDISENAASDCLKVNIGIR